MTQVTDPFERAVQRESRLRKRAAAWETRDGIMTIIPVFFGILGVLWAMVLTAHWVVFADPRWLAVLHTIVFALATIYWTMAYVFVRFMAKRRPDVFGDGG